MARLGPVTLVVLTALLASTFSWGGEVVGEIKKIEGKVFLRKEGAMRKESVEKADTPFAVGDVIETGAKSRAYVKFANGSKAVVEEASQLSITGAEEVATESGSVYFQVKKRKDVIGLQIKSKVAVIGVKGTRFAVAVANERLYVCVDEGVVDIRFVGEKFRRFRQKKEYLPKAGTMEELDRQFEKDVAELNSAFENGVAALEAQYERMVEAMDQQFLSTMDSFDLEAGSGAVVDGSDARDFSTPPVIKKGFSALDRF